MLERIRRARRDESGFTLIELLIVIVILGILATVVVFAVNGIQDRGTAAACKADVQTVTVAAEAYMAKHGTYADSMDELVKVGLLHSVPSSDSYTIDYKADNSDNPKVSVSSDSCADAASDSSTSESAASNQPSGSDRQAAYCKELPNVIQVFQGSSIDSLGPDGFQAWLTEFGRLRALGSPAIARDWLQVSNGLERERQILKNNGVSWNELVILEAGGVPDGLAPPAAAALTSQLKLLLRHGDVDAALKDISGDASSACGIELAG